MLVPDSGRLETGGIGKAGVVSISPVYNVGPDGLPRFLIGDPAFDRDPTLQSDIDDDRLEARWLGNLDRGWQKGLSWSGNRQQRTINVLRQSDQSISSIPRR